MNAMVSERANPKKTIAAAANTSKTLVAGLVCWVGLEEIIDDVRQVEEVEQERAGHNTSPVVPE